MLVIIIFDLLLKQIKKAEINNITRYG